MPAVKKQIDEKGYTNAIVSNNVKSYADDPYFINKAEKAKKILSKTGLPETKKQ